ncbi:hypothetical protein XENTR_v10001628 [Xenopus tropicalis]|uniref:Thioredoxin n=1 Tax=Xenopus tropicalis TaxID=8364 RepID=A0A803J2A4_XENTR|nr:thioredoxin [Xenopus tropicalis]KAE8632678.1 hypothetical protein XENTR_v10001628 [Xenopus tropicalis]
MDQVNDCDELHFALQEAGEKLVLVALSSRRCGHCKLTTPYLESLIPKMPDVVFLKADVSESQEFMELFQVKGVPAFHFFYKCNRLYYFQGANTEFLGNKIEELRRNCNQQTS